MRLSGPGQNVLTTSDQRIVISGRVLDGDRSPVEDALLEVWQASPSGRYRHPDDQRDLPLQEDFTGFGRAATDFQTGEYRFETLKPGPVPDSEGEDQAPHISLMVQGRGMLNPVFTRIYFDDEPDANANDLVLRSVPTERRHTLVARRQDGTLHPEYHFDVIFQGDDETVFFDF
jgi:protocatechuate 3,4-dioxygenase alpha subunit